MQSAVSGPFGTYGAMNQIPALVQAVPPGPVLDPNPDAGPSFFYQSVYMPDCRYVYPKDRVTGRAGVVQGFHGVNEFTAIDVIPAAVATNNIATAQNVASGVAMTLAGASFGVTLNVPIIPFTGILNGSTPVTAAMALDFGFGYATCVANSATITTTAAQLTNYFVGMPLVIGGVGNTAGTVPLLTQVVSINTTNNTVVLVNPCLASLNPAPVGTGNIWSPSGNNADGGPLPPTAAYPFLAAGPALLYDPIQALARGIQIVGASGGAGGTFTVAGWDQYNQAMTETITVGAGAVTGWGKKAFKYLASVTPNFTDAHNYTVGTSDVFGFPVAVARWEDTQTIWAGSLIVGSPNGYVSPQGILTPSTSTTADVRGTFQASASGGGTGASATASNGSLSGLTVVGNRLSIFLRPTLRRTIYATPSNPAYLFGPTQA